MNATFQKYLARPDVTQVKLAEALGVRVATITAWKKGTIPRSPFLPEIEAATDGEVPVSSWFQSQDTAA